MSNPIVRRLGAETLGTGTLVATVVGSGIMAANLTENVALQLIVNALATVAVLGVLIWTLGPISGAHFNPVVTLVAAARREMAAGEACSYIILQVVGAIAGASIADLMFGLPGWQSSTHVRSGAGIWLGEIVATAGLLFVIGALTRSHRGDLGAVLVPAWIGGAYFFTSSTSFANPAVTIGRSLTDTFSGISPASVPAFILFQLVGACVGAGLTELFYPRRGVPEPLDLPGPVHQTPDSGIEAASA